MPLNDTSNYFCILGNLPAARLGSDCSPRVASHPGTRGHSAASAAAVAAPRHKHQTSGGVGGGDASPVRWELPAAVVGALARRFPSARARSADAPHKAKMAATLSACHAVFTRADTAKPGRGKASGRPHSAQARWEAERARLRGWAPYEEVAAPPVGYGLSM